MLQFCEEARNSLRRQVAATFGRSLVSSGRQPLVLLQITISIYSANVFGQSETLSRGKLQLPSADPSLRSRNKAGQAETADFFASDRNQHSLLKVFQISEPSLGASCSYCQADTSRAFPQESGTGGKTAAFLASDKNHHLLVEVLFRLSNICQCMFAATAWSEPPALQYTSSYPQRLIQVIVSPIYYPYLL
jgi:hypothetical protein